MDAVRVHEFGSPDVLTFEEVAVPQPGPGQVLVKIAAAGVNYIDTYQRSGKYNIDLPATLGMEGAGTVEALGEGVTAVGPSARVAYSMHIGAYATYAVVPEMALATVPDEISIETAGAVMLQGMTAHYLSHSTYPIQPGDTVLIHAAAGGVGLLLVQISKKLGARVIGTVSTAEKAALALDFGADHIIRYTEQDFVSEVQRLTQSQGVPVVFDSVGKDTFAGSLDCLQPRGLLALFGQSSGAVPPVDPQILNQKGSLFLTRPGPGPYMRTREEIAWRYDDLFRWIASGELRVRIDRTFALRDAADAHRYIEGRQTKGKVLLLP